MEITDYYFFYGTRADELAFWRLQTGVTVVRR
jgi:hypothetical protein